MNEEIKSSLTRVLPFVAMLLIVLLSIRTGKFTRQSLYINPPVSMNRFFLWTVGFLIFLLLIEFVVYELGILEIDKWNHPFGPSVIRIIGAVILAPISEELIFRGMILHVLTKRLNQHLAIFMQAILFVLLHNFTYQNTLASNIGIVQGLVNASLYGYAKYHTRSIYTPITMHMTGNVIATVERFIF